MATNTTTSLPILRSVPTYYTDDRNAFTSRKDATIHQLGLELRKILIESGYVDNGELKKLALDIAKKPNTFKNVFEKIRRAHRMAD